MRKILKKCLSILMVIAIIFSSAFAGLDGVCLNSNFSFEAKAADESNKTFDEAMYVVRESVTCDGEITYVVYLRAGAKVSDAIINIEFEDSALEVDNFGEYTVVNDYSELEPNIPGIYEHGLLWNSTNVCTIAYVNTDPVLLSADTPFMKIKFNMNYGYTSADIKFSCVEFHNENGGFNVSRAEEPVVIFEDALDINVVEHIVGDWVQHQPTVYSDGMKYRRCIVCGQTIEKIVLPQLICQKPELIGVAQEEDGLVFGWNSVNGADSYSVYRKTNSTDWVLLAQVDGSTTAYIDYDVETDVEYYYTVCAINEAGASSYDTVGAFGEIHVHRFGDWKITVPATCTTSGKKIRSCSCGDEEVLDIDALGHDYSEEWTVDIEPTCIKEGSKSHHCTACGNKSDVTSIPSLDHNYSEEWTIDIAPTCYQEGSKSHHCIYCNDKTDITTIMVTDHNYEMKSSEEAHPHKTVYQCSYCEVTKTESTTVSDCLECNFIVTYDSQTNSYKLMSYIGNQTDVVIPAEYNGCAITGINRSCFKDKKTITSVRIPDSVKTINEMAFMNCTSLERVYILSSVTSIDTNAFYGATDELTIYCYRGSAAREFAIENDIEYVLMDNIETDQVTIDFANSLIFTSIQGCENPGELWIASDTAEVIAVPSLVHGNIERYGTGTELAVFDDGKYIGEFTLIVEGDLNGDSICDVLDSSVAYLYSADMVEPTENEIFAANGCVSDELDANAYQNVVNIMLEG